MLKRILVIVACIAILTSSMAFATTAVIGNVTAVAVDQTATVEFRVTNSSGTGANFEPFVAIYNSQNQLIDFKIAESKTIGAGLSAAFSVNCTVPADKTGIYGKVFVWGDDYAPCADIKPFTINMSVITGKDDALYTPNY